MERFKSGCRSHILSEAIPILVLRKKGEFPVVCTVVCGVVCVCVNVCESETQRERERERERERRGKKNSKKYKTYLCTTSPC